jgi:hypothetical protein
MSMACGSTGEPLLSRLPNRAGRVNSFLRFSSTLRTSVITDSLHQQRATSPQPRTRLAFTRRGPCVPSRSAPGLSHALHQVRKQGCPSSQAHSSPKGGSRQEIADIPRFAAPPGDAHRARGSLISLLLNMLGANPVLIRRHLHRGYRAGFNRSRCVTLAPNPTWKSVSLIHIRCRMLASLRATAVIAHSMLERLAIRRPQARSADHFLIRSSRHAAASQSASRTATSPCLLMRPRSRSTCRTGAASAPNQNGHPPFAIAQSDEGHQRQP